MQVLARSQDYTKDLGSVTDGIAFKGELTCALQPAPWVVLNVNFCRFFLTINVFLPLH